MRTKQTFLTSVFIAGAVTLIVAVLAGVPWFVDWVVDNLIIFGDPQLTHPVFIESIGELILMVVVGYFVVKLTAKRLERSFAQAAIYVSCASGALMAFAIVINPGAPLVWRFVYLASCIICVAAGFQSKRVIGRIYATRAMPSVF